MSNSSESKLTFSDFISLYSSLFPLATAFLIVLGLLKMILKYWFYNINILEFITLSEALLFFVQEAGLIILVIVLTAALVLFQEYYDITISSDNSNDNIKILADEIISPTKRQKLLMKKLHKQSLLIISISLLIFLIIMIILKIANTSIYTFNNTFLLLLTFNILIFIRTIETHMRAQSYLNNYKYSKKDFFIIIFCMVLSFTYLKIGFNENEKKYGSFKHKEDIIYLKSNNIIKLNSRKYIIGRIEKTTFLYDKDKGITILIPNEEILSYELKN